ncbi:hypothetical protein [Pleurochrysis sp. endemic virus 1a]|nr:hypothetical protein [Pleurochrysis sp. endemic virus 1a]AUL80785.1 hypothetical protein [Pleurochrysis sp. endemic virus 1b]|mmetsp:Transcript_29428/g.64447  ORF Transcript_29428/g.64447 Transcript_29428/m.64447 type:complete len:233 (-) Transcript_29428:8030-8728(-)
MPPKQDGAPDPLDMGGLDPSAIQNAMEAKNKKKSAASEIDLMKEQRQLMKEKRLANNEKKFESAPPPGPKYTEEEKQAMLDKLTSYRERFTFLKKRNNVSARSHGEEIADELHYCEMQLGSRQDGSMGVMMLTSLMSGLETVSRDVWNPLGLNLDGLGAVTKANIAEFQPILDELMIKYGSGMYMSAELRLALSISALIMTVHAANSGDARVTAALSKVNGAVNVPASSKDL